jgi:four helix bundle protein
MNAGRGAGEQGSGGAGERGSRGAGEQGSGGAGEQGSGGAGEQGSRGAGEQGRDTVNDREEIYPASDLEGFVTEPPASGVVRHDQLEVFEIAFQAANSIFGLTKDFPNEERFSLTDQMRKSSRSVCANIAEGWRKRRYKAAFQSALNVAEAEAAETQTWLRFAIECGYVDKEAADALINIYDSVIGKLVVMINNPNPWLLKGVDKV